MGLLTRYSVVQRQIWLMEHQGLTKSEAYDKARKEFYKRREREEVMRRTAKEEALYSGARFGLSTLEVGSRLDNKAFEEWKAWAQNEVTVMRQTQGSAYGGADMAEEEVVEADTPTLIEDGGDSSPEALTSNVQK